MREKSVRRKSEEEKSIKQNEQATQYEGKECEEEE